MLLFKTKHESYETRILKELKKCGSYGQYNHVLARQSIGGLDWRKRISNLRKDGYNIQHIQVSKTAHKYYYLPGLKEERI